MDVVRTNIEKIGGTIELSSVEGRGTKFVIKIPLTLAIVSALIVECASERFAIPHLSVVELVRASAHTEHTIASINGTPVLRLRNRLQIGIASWRERVCPYVWISVAAEALNKKHYNIRHNTINRTPNSQTVNKIQSPAI